MKTLFILSLSLWSFISFSQAYDIYVSDAGNFNNPPWQILKYDSNGENATTFISSNLNWPQDILFLEDSSIVLISNLGTNNISRYHATTGAYINDFATGISGPTRFKVGRDGLLYVLQWSGNGSVKRYQMDGTYVDDFTSIGVPQSIGMDWDSGGNLYVSSYNGDLVRKFDTAGNDLGIFINSNLVGPTNIWFDTNGDLLVTDYDGTAVKRFDSTGTFLGNFMTGLNNAEGVVILPNGNYLIGNGGSSSVKEFDGSGTYIRDIIPSGLGGLLKPNAIVLRPFSNISVPENELNEPFLYPSQGTYFKLDTELAPQVEQITVLDSSSKLILETTKPYWQADASVDGFYFVQIKLRNGKIRSQKVLVKH